MKMRNQNRAVVFAAATAALAAISGTHVSAAEVYWRGGAGNITDTNYTSDGTNTIPYTQGDVMNLGGVNAAIDVTTSINYSATPANAPKSIHVGHNFSLFPGPASLLVKAGGLVIKGNPNATNAFDKAALIVGYNADGNFSVGDGANVGGNTHMDGLTIVGAKTNDAFAGTGTGTLNVNRSNFRVRNSDLIIGYGNKGVLNHGAGNMQVLHNVAASVNGEYDMYVGYTTASEWNKYFDGFCLINNNLFIGSGSLVNLQCGPITTKANPNATGGDIVVGRNGSSNDRLNISWNGAGGVAGPTVVTVGKRFLLASGGGGATASTVNQSSGTVNVALNLSVSDTDNTSNATYNLSGGALNANSGLSRVGRRGNGQMIQTGGTATFNAGLAVGDDDSTAPGETDNATGLYEISAGTLTTNLAGDALRLGSAGNGTLRVVGQNGVINVNGNLTSSNTSDGAGNLAYKFEAGESLSTVNVTGTATFAFNSGLAIDSSAISTPASGTTYNLVSAADVTDNGLLLTDWGWTHQVVPGGAGKLLQAVKTTPQYWDTDGVTPGAGGAAPSGAWNGAAANFSTDSTGSSATGATTGVLDDVVFAAGSDGAGSYTVTVSGTQTAHAVQFARGNVLLSGGGTLAVGHFDAVSGATGTVSSNIAGDAFGRVIKSGAGTITLASANSYAGGTIVSGGTLVLGNADATGGGSINVADGALAQAQASLPKAVTVTTVTINATGRLDLSNNKLVTNTPIGTFTGEPGVGTYDGIQGMVARAYNFGSWDQPGLTTSEDLAGPNAGPLSNTTTIGVATGEQVMFLGPTDTAVFQGQTITGATTIAMYTYAGDVNFDGLVDASDYGIIDNYYQFPGTTGYANGDFNYDGIIDAGDYGIIDNTIQLQGDPIPGVVFGASALASASGGGLSGVTAVPEPSACGFALLGAAAVVGRRRRRHV
jgi:autotransporter-associated beta strand protein